MVQAKPIRILSVEDHPVFRQGLAAIVSAERDMLLVGQASNAVDAVAEFRRHRPDITLMDVRLPGTDGTDALDEIRGEFRQSRIIMLTTSDGDGDIQRAMRAGASGYTGEANYYYTDYDTSLRNPDTQRLMASALTELSKRLSNPNRKDLRDTPSTLAANGLLQPVAALFRVHRSIWDVCPVPLADRLHPDLLAHWGLARFAKAFEVDDWIRSVAQRCQEGTADMSEREATYQYLLAHGSTLKTTTIAAVRHSPIVKDQRNEWVTPTSLISRHAKYFGDLERALSAPSEELERAPEMARRLRIRAKLNGADLVRCAAFVTTNSGLAEQFENVLSNMPQLLTPATAKNLSTIAFLRSTRGELATPDSLHQRTSVNLGCLELEDGFVLGTHTNLYRRLGCPERPTSRVLLGAIERWRGARRGPADLPKFYTVLVDALRRARVSASA